MREHVVQTETRTITRNTRQINVIIHQTPQPDVQTIAIENKIQTSEQTWLPYEGPCAEIFRELNDMIGLDEVKEIMNEVYAMLQIKKYREQAGLSTDAHVFHMVFRGNPGTGKTTVARLVARLFQAMGVLQKGHMIEVERADLVGEYIGHTAVKTRDLVKKAMGGILFIDEAYSLARGGEKDFGKESIDALVKAMEDYKNQFILILAGYSDEMEEFLLTNPGLPSRFPIQIDFPDYTVDQLLRIAEQMMNTQQYCLMPNAYVKLKQHLIRKTQSETYLFSNARYVRNQLEKAIRYQAVRLLKLQPLVPSKQELMTLHADDFRFGG